MFSGLTSQVSNWMGKKNEDGTTELPHDDKPASSPSGAEAEFEGEKKDSRYV